MKFQISTIKFPRKQLPYQMTYFAGQFPGNQAQRHPIQMVLSDFNLILRSFFLAMSFYARNVF